MKFNGLLGMAVAAWLAGCASTSGTRSEPATGVATAPAHESGMGMMAGKCPMKVPGTTVTTADEEGAIALAFTTTGTGDVAELRQRVRGMAEMHNKHHAAGGMKMGGQAAGGAAAEHEPGAGTAPGNEAGETGGMMKGGMMMPAATASVEDIENGARLVLRPKDPAELEALRRHARMHAERMARGECPMMSPGAQGQATPPPRADADHEAHRSSSGM